MNLKRFNHDTMGLWLNQQESLIFLIDPIQSCQICGRLWKFYPFSKSLYIMRVNPQGKMQKCVRSDSEHFCVLRAFFMIYTENVGLDGAGTSSLARSLVSDLGDRSRLICVSMAELTVSIVGVFSKPCVPCQSLAANFLFYFFVNFIWDSAFASPGISRLMRPPPFFATYTPTHPFRFHISERFLVGKSVIFTISGTGVWNPSSLWTPMSRSENPMGYARSVWNCCDFVDFGMSLSLWFKIGKSWNWYVAILSNAWTCYEFGVYGLDLWVLACSE